MQSDAVPNSTSQVTGIYDLSFHRMYEACNWAHMRWMINGNTKINTHEHVPHGSWQISNIRMVSYRPPIFPLLRRG